MSNQIIEEGKTTDGPDALNKKQSKEILREQSQTLYQITTDKKKGSCFLCKVPNKGNEIFLVITCNHVLDETQMEPGKEIKIYCTDDDDNKQFKTIKFAKNRTTYSIGSINGEDVDVTIIEVWPKVDGFNEQDFIQIDKDLMSNNIEELYKNESVYLLHYKDGKESSFSLGVIKKVLKGGKNYTLYHSCESGNGSSGGPIVLYNHKAIGVHRGFLPKKDSNSASLLQFPIKEFLKKLEVKNNINEIKIKIVYDINKNDRIKIFGKKFVEKNKNICKMYINEQEYDICENVNFNKYGVNNSDKSLIIALAGFNEITDASDMFEGCDSLQSLPDISKWDTKKVTNMENMFFGCSSLKTLSDVSKWNTKNVLSMRNMFRGCRSLESKPDNSNWDTNKVEDERDMFFGTPYNK